MIRAAAVVSRGRRIPVDALPAALRAEPATPATTQMETARLVEIVRRQGSITPAEARAVLRVGRTRAFEVLRELEVAQVVQRRGKGRATCYVGVGGRERAAMLTSVTE